MQWLRKCAVAGSFYPAEKSKIIGFFEKVDLKASSAKAHPVAIVAPHAGYIYSGRIAADVYKKTPISSSVILLAPNHSGMGPRISIWAKGAWETPLGEVPIDESLSASILKSCPDAVCDQQAHLHEHAIEVHLPFLRWLRPDVKIVPIVLGPLRLETCKTFGEALAAAMSKQKERPLIVASTDMSHYISADQAKKLDALALKPLESLDADSLYLSVVQNEISMCGFIPTSCMAIAARKLGAKKATIISYGNSGDTTHDYSSVVAYVSASIG